MLICNRYEIIKHNISVPYDIILYIGTFLSDYDKIKYMMLNKYINQNAHTFVNPNVAISKACKENDFQMILNYLMNNLIQYKQIIHYIYKYNSIEILSKILEMNKDIEIDIIYVKNALLTNRYELFKQLYNLPQIKNKNLISTFDDACRLGLYDIVKLMLETQNINEKYSAGIRFAILNNYPNIVKLLLKDDRLDPSYAYNAPFRFALENKNFEIVKLLLNDRRVNINNINIANIKIIMDNDNIFRYILLLKKTTSEFITTSINTINLNPSYIRYLNELLMHPKCNLYRLFNMSNEISLNRNIYNINIFEILLSFRDLHFTKLVIKFIYENRFYNLIRTLYCRNNQYLKNIANSIITNSLSCEDFIEKIYPPLYKKLNEYQIIFDELYKDGEYEKCKTLIINNFVDIKYITNKFKYGDYKMLSKYLLNYY